MKFLNKEFKYSAGVYKITNIVNNKSYIGSSVSLYERFKKHRKTLRGLKHDNFHLQNSWNKYREENFKFEIILISDKKDIILYEQILLDFFDCYKKGYNRSPTAGNSFGCVRSEEDKLRKSEAMKSRWKEGAFAGRIQPKNRPKWSKERMDKYSATIQKRRNSLSVL